MPRKGCHCNLSWDGSWTRRNYCGCEKYARCKATLFRYTMRLRRLNDVRWRNLIRGRHSGRWCWYTNVRILGVCWPPLPTAQKIMVASWRLLGSLGHERGIETPSLCVTCALQSRHRSPEFHCFIAGKISSLRLCFYSRLTNRGWNWLATNTRPYLTSGSYWSGIRSVPYDISRSSSHTGLSSVRVVMIGHMSIVFRPGVEFLKLAHFHA